MKLKVKNRELIGKQVKTLRQEWLIPGVVYSKHIKESISLMFNKMEFLKVFEKAWESTPIDLEWDIKQMVLVYDVQVDPVTNQLLHVDFLAVKADEAVEAEIPVVLEWESPLEKAKEWRIEQVKDTVLVSAFPKDLPHNIVIDIAKIETLNDAIFVKDLKLWDKVEIVDNLELPIVIAARLSEEVEEEVPAEATEGEEWTAQEWAESKEEKAE